jgi:hypothetical protein
LAQETKHNKAIEQISTQYQVINEKYQAFLKEKMIF